MNNEYRWPKKGANAFDVASIDVTSSTFAAVRYLDDIHTDDSWLADAFKVAADKIIHELTQENGQEPADVYFMPIGYLYRHALELKLKRIIRLSFRLKLLEENQKTSKRLEEHRLCPLWHNVKESFLKFWPGAPTEEIDGVERFIQSFHGMDSSGQNLRYTVDSRGQSTIPKMPEYVELVHLKEVCNGVFTLLSACETTFDHAIEMESEAAQEYDAE